MGGAIQRNPWAEAKISAHSLFAEQTVIYSVKVISPSQLSIKTIPTPTASSSVFERIDDNPVVFHQIIDGQRYLISEYRYALMPLSAGTLEIDPTTVEVNWEGTLSNNVPPYYPPWTRQRRQPQIMTLKTKPLILEVKAALTAKQGMPLYSLSVSEKFQKEQVFKAGDPIPYTVTIVAVGARGEDLPDINDLIPQQDFKQYKESVHTEKSLSRDGTTVAGKRVETYTLIPQRTGDIQIPARRIHWWDIKSGYEVWTELPAQIITIAGVQVASNKVATPEVARPAIETRSVVRAFSLMLIAIVIFFAGIWLGAGKPGMDIVRDHSRKVIIFLYQRLNMLLQIVKYRTNQFLLFFQCLRRSDRHDQKVNQRDLISCLFTRHKHKLPSIVRMTHFIWGFNKENDAKELYQLLLHFASACLGMSRNAPFHSIANTLCDTYSQLDREEVLTLFRQLEDVVFGDKAFDLSQWKSRFMVQFKYLPLHRVCSKPQKKTIGLPALNPSPFWN